MRDRRSLVALRQGLDQLSAPEQLERTVALRIVPELALFHVRGGHSAAAIKANPKHAAVLKTLSDTDVAAVVTHVKGLAAGKSTGRAGGVADSHRRRGPAGRGADAHNGRDTDSGRRQLLTPIAWSVEFQQPIRAGT
jgi:hypothetical protein